jgi:hypothetical protein
MGLRLEGNSSNYVLGLACYGLDQGSLRYLKFMAGHFVSRLM